MPAFFKHNLIAFTILCWQVIGSSARGEQLLGTAFLCFFFLVALAYGRYRFSGFELLGSALILGVVLLYASQASFEIWRTVYFIVELLFFLAIFRQPGNVSFIHLGAWCAAYAIILLFWKVGIAGYGLLQRENMLISGPIKYSMISAIGYTLLLFRVRTTRYPRWPESLILILVLIGITSSLSRTPIAFSFAVTVWYLIRRASMTHKLLAGGAAFLFGGAVTQSRVFYIANSPGNLLERISGARYLAWEDAINLIRLEPLFGPGGQIFRETNRVFLEYPHNFILELLLNTGIVGTSIYLIVLLWQWRQWSMFNLTILAVSITSGDIYLWSKVLFVAVPACGLLSVSTQKTQPSVSDESGLVRLS